MYNATILFCATTLGTLVAVASLLYIVFRKVEGRGVFAPLQHIGERIQNIFLLVSIVVLTLTVNTILKNIFRVARPSGHPLLVLNDFAFPSGHAGVYLALAGGLFLINHRAGYIAGFCALIIGIARVVAGVHSPLDILGGYVLAVVIVSAVSWFISLSTKDK